MSEADHQAALMRWARMQEATRPEFKLLHAIPNGGYALTKASAWHMKQRGVKAGVPDLCLPIARGRYHGLYIEMKDEIARGKTKPVVTPEQREWIEALSFEGYLAVVCYGWLTATTVLNEYLALERQRAAQLMPA